MTALAELLRERIAREGPISVADYMQTVLADPDHGYYMAGDPLGRGGDFTTAPEISQMFGELIGLWCVVVWRQMGEPGACHLVELGPGRGTLMADALRAAAAVPEFGAAVALHFVETSPALKDRQAETLAAIAHPDWHNDFAAVPGGPTIVVANEFFDALPVHQFQMTGAGWRERLVGCRDGGFEFLNGGDAPASGLVPEKLANAPPGSLFEARPAATRMMTAIAQRLAEYGGAALIIDYGHAISAPGDTLQAVKDHRYHDPLAAPGQADLTAHVDFEELSQAAEAGGARVWPLRDQRDFLISLGIGQRAQNLLAGADAAACDDINAALNRLIEPGEMGTLFKVLAVDHPGQPVPPGIEE